MKNKSVLIAFVLGALFVVFLYHAYTVYELRAISLQNSADIQRIANFLNGVTGNQAQATPTPVAPTPTPVTSKK